MLGPDGLARCLSVMDESLDLISGLYLETAFNGGRTDGNFPHDHEG